MNKKDSTLIILGIIGISFNLRAPITAVGSVVEMIQAEYALSGSAAGFITTLPLIAFAIFSPFVANISQKLGYGKTMAGGLLLIIAGELIRSYTNILGLFAGTAILGLGIAIGNVLIPSIIKMKFANKVGSVTSIYISGMCIFAAVGAGISVPLAQGLNLGWKNSLASWGILAVITLVIWLPQLKKSQSTQNSTPSTSTNTTKSTETTPNTIKKNSIWKSPTAWWVTLFMGTQSLLFYSLVAWLPTIIVSKGMSESFAGTMALLLQLIAIPATLTIPIVCHKFKNQRGLSLCGSLTYLTGTTLLLFAQSQITIFFAVLFMSLALGASISLSIAFISLRSPTTERASELSGMSQSAGYILAAIGPILSGLLYDTLHTWTVPILLFCAFTILLTVFGYFAGTDVFIRED